MNNRATEEEQRTAEAYGARKHTRTQADDMISEGGPVWGPVYDSFSKVGREEGKPVYTIKPGMWHRSVPVGNQTEAMQRKGTPVGTGFVDYFPLAMQEVAKVSLAGQKQHGLDDGGPLRWARELSADESDALMRHFIERGTLDTDGLRHTAKMAWRAMALLEKELENDSK